ncbi:MAG: WD40 repeat domain-containing protein [Pirellulales bacterium]
MQTFSMPQDNEDRTFSSDILMDYASDGSKLYSYHEHSRSLFVHDCITGSTRKLATLAKDSGTEYLTFKQLKSTKQGDLLLVCPEHIVQLKSSGDIRLRKPQDKLTLNRIETDGDLIYANAYTPREGLIFGDSIIVEYDARSFRELRRWSCDTTDLKLVNGKPVFVRNGGLHGVNANGVDLMTTLRSQVNQLGVSMDGKRLVATINGGIRIWDLEDSGAWKIVSASDGPDQGDNQFQIDDAGTITLVSNTDVLRSKNDRFQTSQSLGSTLSTNITYRTLAADGLTIAAIGKDGHVHVAKIDREHSSIRLNIPDRSKPTMVRVAEDGSRVAVVFMPTVNVDTQGKQRAQSSGIESAFFQGLQAGMSGSENKRPCAIYQLPSPNPVAQAVIGETSLLSGQNGFALFSKSETLYWSGPNRFGSWKFGSSDSKPKTKAMGPTESFKCYAINSLGDVAYSSRSEENGVSGNVNWFGNSQKRPIRITSEKAQEPFGAVVELAEDGTTIYVAQADGRQATLKKLEMPSKTELWRVSLPSPALKMRLSRNGTYLAVQLCDSRYAVVDVAQR